jgi:hypothetical protein
MEPVSQKRTGPSPQGQAQGWSEAERYLGVLGDDSPGSAGGWMPTSAPVSSGVKAAGGRMPTSAPVSVSCFGT